MDSKGELTGKLNVPIRDFPIQEGITDPEAIDSNLLQEYGNNYFELTTYDKALVSTSDGVSAGKLRLAGVLKEIPSFSMNTTWEKGPASSISDTVKGFMCSSTMEMVNTIGGNDISWMNLDEGTDRTYSSTSRPTFDLTFRIYTTETIGSHPLTNWKTWLRCLSLFTMPCIENKVNLNRMTSNIIDSGIGILGKLTTSFKSAAKSFTEGQNDKDIVSNIATSINDFGDTAQSQITSRDGVNRVKSKSNTDNFYGAKLWYLSVLPGIFTKPLIVYISNWGITYSKELNMSNNQEPIWVEFKLTCEMDQIASAPVWEKYFI